MYSSRILPADGYAYELTFAAGVYVDIPSGQLQHQLLTVPVAQQ
jgi:hypothetical protein